MLLTVYSVAIIAAALLGVWLQTAIRFTHTRMQVAMSFVAGLVLGVALYHLLPHSLDLISGPSAVEVAVQWVAIGMILMIMLLRVFQFHQHDFGLEEDHHHGHHHHRENSRRSLDWIGISLGMGLHALAEGAALGASVRSGSRDELAVDPLSFAMFLAIVFHKPLDAFSVLGVMRIAGIGHRAAVWFNVCIALLCPLGAYLTLGGLGLFGSGEGDAIARALAFGAGALICVSLSDLLPEIHFHGHDRFLLAVSFLLGIGLAYALHYLEQLAMLAIPSLVP